METVLIGGNLGENPSSLGYLCTEQSESARGEARRSQAGTDGNSWDWWQEATHYLGNYTHIPLTLLIWLESGPTAVSAPAGSAFRHAVSNADSTWEVWREEPSQQRIAALQDGTAAMANQRLYGNWKNSVWLGVGKTALDRKGIERGVRIEIS